MLGKLARQRWQAEQLESAEDYLVKASTPPRMAAMPVSPFGLTEEGMYDYRGATLSRAVRYLKVENVDFSDVIFRDGASISESEVSDCRLDRIDMRGVFVRRSFTRCSFKGAKLSGARLGTEFVDCDFTGANFAKAFATDCRFTRCVFDDASLVGVHFISCKFEDCDFSKVKRISGSVAGSTFSPGIVLDEFRDCVVDNIKIRA